LGLGALREGAHLREHRAMANIHQPASTTYHHESTTPTKLPACLESADGAGHYTHFTYKASILLSWEPHEGVWQIQVGGRWLWPYAGGLLLREQQGPSQRPSPSICHSHHHKSPTVTKALARLESVYGVGNSRVSAWSMASSRSLRSIPKHIGKMLGPFPLLEWEPLFKSEQPSWMIS